MAPIIPQPGRRFTAVSLLAKPRGFADTERAGFGPGTFASSGVVPSMDVSHLSGGAGGHMLEGIRNSSSERGL
jgi:hypothetical protein